LALVKCLFLAKALQVIPETLEPQVIPEVVQAIPVLGAAALVVEVLRSGHFSVAQTLLFLAQDRVVMVLGAEVPESILPRAVLAGLHPLPTVLAVETQALREVRAPPVAVQVIPALAVMRAPQAVLLLVCRKLYPGVLLVMVVLLVMAVTLVVEAAGEMVETVETADEVTINPSSTGAQGAVVEALQLALREDLFRGSPGFVAAEVAVVLTPPRAPQKTRPVLVARPEALGDNEIAAALLGPDFAVVLPGVVDEVVAAVEAVPLLLQGPILAQGRVVAEVEVLLPEILRAVEIPAQAATLAHQQTPQPLTALAFHRVARFQFLLPAPEGK
jgi:hypothetical protein